MKRHRLISIENPAIARQNQRYIRRWKSRPGHRREVYKFTHQRYRGLEYWKMEAPMRRGQPCPIAHIEALEHALPIHLNPFALRLAAVAKGFRPMRRRRELYCGSALA